MLSACSLTAIVPDRLCASMARHFKVFHSLPRLRFQHHGLEMQAVLKQCALLAGNGSTVRSRYPLCTLAAKARCYHGSTDGPSTATIRYTNSAPPRNKLRPSAARNQPQPTESAKEKSETKVAETVESAQSLWGSNDEPLLSSILLRDGCRCGQCIDPSTKQRNFSFVDIPENVRALPGGRTEDGKFIVKWENDIDDFTDHKSYFSLDELRYLGSDKITNPLPRPHPPQSWDTSAITERLLTVTYEDYMTSEVHLLKSLQALQRDGLIFVKNVPPSVESVGQIVERIGPIRNTFYGSTWDVKSKPSADNVAYTDKELGFHMDLLYMSLAPKYQFLHCVQNTCTGGESRFLDTTRAREIMTADTPDQARALRSLVTRYHYQNKGHAYTNARAVFARDSGTVFWSPPFVDQFQANPGKSEDLQRSLAAAKTFAEILKREDLIYETKMEEGTCAIFENIRVVHARKAFDVNSGHRWLRGAYLDGQPLHSTYTRLLRQMVDI